MPIQLTPDTLPDYHFLFIAPNLGVEWFAEAARRYWERYQPTVISDAELISIVPEDQTVAVSLLALRDSFRTLAVEIAQARADHLLDTVLYDTVADAKIALDRRTELNQPFGVPLLPTPVPPTREPIQPPPGSVVGGDQLPLATPNTSGFITQVPTSPPGFITQTPSPTPSATQPNLPNNTDDDSGGDPPSPITPTPGAILGG